MSNPLTLMFAGSSARSTPPVRSIGGLMKAFIQGNEKRKRDPHTPALRTKGEKARNRRNRIGK